MRCGRVENILKIAVLWLIGVVSGFFRALGWRTCRFYPSCSCYARAAFGEADFFKASGFVIQRVFKCHPFSAGGYDPFRFSPKKDY